MLKGLFFSFLFCVLINNSKGDGFVIYRENYFDEPTIYKYKYFRSVEKLVDIIYFKDSTGLSFELYPKRHVPFIVSSPENAGDSYESCLASVSKAETAFPHLATSIRDFKNKLLIRKEQEFKNPKLESHLPPPVPTNAKSISYFNEKISMVSKLFTINGVLQLDTLQIGYDKYYEVQIQRTNNQGISILHKDGSRNIPWGKLPPEIQTALGHDPNSKIVASSSTSSAVQISAPFEEQKPMIFLILQSPEKVNFKNCLYNLKSGVEYPIVGLRKDRNAIIVFNGYTIEYGVGDGSQVKSALPRVSPNYSIEISDLIQSVHFESDAGKLHSGYFPSSEIPAHWEYNISCNIKNAPPESYAFIEMLVGNAVLNKSLLPIERNSELDHTFNLRAKALGVSYNIYIFNSGKLIDSRSFSFSDVK